MYNNKQMQINELTFQGSGNEKVHSASEEHILGFTPWDKDKEIKGPCILPWEAPTCTAV